jgi:CPA1 family monovalent cation:H+ antiporter
MQWFGDNLIGMLTLVNSLPQRSRDRILLAVPVSGGDSNLAEVLTVLIVLLLVATGVALISRRLRIPYIAGLVLAGLAITELLPDLHRIRLDSSLIFNLFLPILLFESALNTDISRLRSTIKPHCPACGAGDFAVCWHHLRFAETRARFRLDTRLIGRRNFVHYGYSPSDCGV